MEGRRSDQVENKERSGRKIGEEMEEEGGERMKWRKRCNWKKKENFEILKRREKGGRMKEAEWKRRMKEEGGRRMKEGGGRRR